MKKSLIWVILVFCVSLACKNQTHVPDIKPNLEETVESQEIPSISIEKTEPLDLLINVKFPKFTYPLKKFAISSNFGERGQVVKGIGGDDGDLHKGIDMVPASKNANIFSAADGTVYIHYPPPGTLAKSGNKYKGHPVYGALIVLDHGNGIYTLYGHMKETWVRTGQKIKQGEPMGVVGSTGISTGVHLHFEIIFNPMTILQESEKLEKNQ